MKKNNPLPPKALIHRETILETIVKNAAAFVWTIDTSGEITFVQKNLAADSENEPTVGQSIFDRVKHLPHFMQAIETALAGTPSKAVAFSKDKWFESNLTPVKNDFGEVSAVVGITLDVTHRVLSAEAQSKLLAERKARLLVQESEEKFRTAFENSPSGMALLALDGSWIQVNKSLCEILGYPQEELFHFHFNELTHPEDRLKSLIMHQELISNSRSSILFEKRYLHKSGKTVWALLSASLVKNSQGEPLYTICQTIDITAQKESQERLIENQAFLQTILDNLPVALFCKDYSKGLKFSLWNKYANRLWGMSAEQVLGKNDYDFFPKEQADFFRSKDVETLKQGSAVEIPEEPITLPSGETLILKTKKVPILNSDGSPSHLLGISEDITQLKEKEKVIEEQRSQLIHAEKIKSLNEIAGGIAHELNTPLTVVQLNTSRILEIISSDSWDQAELTSISEQILKTSQRMEKIIKGLQKLATNGQQDPLEAIRIHSVILDALEFFQARFSIYKIDVKLNPFPTHTLVRARGIELLQVLINLLHHSFDSAVISPSKWIQIDVQAFDKEVILTITDSGDGKHLGTLINMAKPFMSEAQGPTKHVNGLSHCRKLIESQQGSLDYICEENHNRFILKLLPVELNRLFEPQLDSQTPSESQIGPRGNQCS